MWIMKDAVPECLNVYVQNNQENEMILKFRLCVKPCNTKSSCGRTSDDYMSTTLLDDQNVRMWRPVEEGGGRVSRYNCVKEILALVFCAMSSSEHWSKQVTV